MLDDSLNRAAWDDFRYKNQKKPKEATRIRPRFYMPLSTAFSGHRLSLKVIMMRHKEHIRIGYAPKDQDPGKPIAIRAKSLSIWV